MSSLSHRELLRWLATSLPIGVLAACQASAPAVAPTAPPATLPVLGAPTATAAPHPHPS
jgi:hypothetical protein